MAGSNSQSVRSTSLEGYRPGIVEQPNDEGPSIVDVLGKSGDISKLSPTQLKLYSEIRELNPSWQVRVLEIARMNFGDSGSGYENIYLFALNAETRLREAVREATEEIKSTRGQISKLTQVIA